MVLGMVCACAGAGAFFISPSGSDANPGTEAKPFATLEAARDAIRRLKRDGGLPTGGVTVWIRGGDYVRERAFELTAQDSGTAEAPIVYRGVATEPVRLLGGRRVSGFQRVTDPARLARLSAAARAHVLEADLRAQGITNFGELRSRGFGRPLTPAHAELFFRGQPMTLARWPNAGAWEHIAGFPERAGKGDDHGGKIGDLADGFFYAGDRPRGWRHWDDVWVHGYWAWDWANSYERVESLDVESRHLKTAPPHGLYGFRKGQRFYFLNVLEELDQPGEWFLDRAAGKLYFWPPGAVTSLQGYSVTQEGGRAPAAPRDDRSLSEATHEPVDEAWISLLDRPLLSLDEVSHITFRGLILEATRGSAVSIRGGQSNRLVACALRNLGNYGVVIEGGRGHRVEACDVENTGDGGVSLSGGDRQTLAPSGHVVENCHFQKQGRWSKCYVPAILMNGVGHRAAHNLIHDHPHCAILFTGNDHWIEFNEIHHIALETGDVGAIYTGRDYTYRGNRIRHNFIHHTGGVGMGSMGVYMDDCVSGTEIFGNVFYRVHWAVFLGGGRDHRVENNLFVECDPAVRADGRGLDPSPVWRGMVDDTMRRRLRAVPLAFYRERYPALRSLDRYYGAPDGPPLVGADFTGVPPENNLIARNVCVGKWLELAWHAQPEWFNVRDNYVGAEVGLVAPDQMDFRIQPDSPVWKTGFQPIPFAQIGLQPDPLRQELEQRLAAADRRPGAPPAQSSKPQ